MNNLTHSYGTIIHVENFITTSAPKSKVTKKAKTINKCVFYQKKQCLLCNFLCSYKNKKMQQCPYFEKTRYKSVLYLKKQKYLDFLLKNIKQTKKINSEDKDTLNHIKTRFSELSKIYSIIKATDLSFFDFTANNQLPQKKDTVEYRDFKESIEKIQTAIKTDIKKS